MVDGQSQKKPVEVSGQLQRFCNVGQYNERTSLHIPLSEHA